MTEPTGRLSFGDVAARIVSGRIAGAFATTTTLKALPAKSRQDGQIAITMADQGLWVFDADSAAAGSATVLVPDAGSGRWLAGVDVDGTLKALLALTTTGNGASLIGIEDAANNFSPAANVEAALAEIFTTYASTDPAKGAALVGYDGGTTVKAELDAIVAAGMLKASKTVGFADLVALGAVQQGDIAFDAALPAGAVVVGYGANVTAIFDNAGDTASVTFDLESVAAAADMVDGGSLNAVAKVATPVPAAGPLAGQLMGAITPNVRFNADVNFDTLTKGAATFYVLYALAF